MNLKNVINNTIRQYLNEETDNNNLMYNYRFDPEKSGLNNLIQNARKWQENEFIEEYVDYNDINIYPKSSMLQPIKKGDEVILVRNVRDDRGKTIPGKYAFYKKVVADKDYGTDGWKFIMDNTKELQQEARKMYHKYKNKKKPEFKDETNTIKGYHASPHNFHRFKYGEHRQSGQLGSEFGFFFFKDLKNAEYYANTIKEHNNQAYIYECTIKLGEYDVWKGEDIGTGWGRLSDLEQAPIEGYDVIIIEDADTGYGITDEIVVFDDDNIRIDRVVEV